MASYYDTYSVYSSLRKSAERAFDIAWDRLPLSERLPVDFRKCVEEALSAMRRAKRISDIVIAKNEVAKKQADLKKAESELKDLENPETSKTECA